MKWRLFLTYMALLIPSLAMLEYGWWLVVQAWGLEYSYIWNFRFIPFIVAAIATIIIWAIWNFELRRTEQSKARRAKATSEDNSSLEKRKRDRIDSVLRDLSDEDLLRLRQRLNDGIINDDSLEEQLIGEDGELLRERH
jgi:hypothetical protein